MVRRIARLSVLIAVCPSVSLGQAEPLSKSGAVLTGMAAWRVLEPCTRVRPDAPDSLWAPGPTEIANLERGLAPLLQGMLDSVRRDPRNGFEALAGDYLRQYVGVIIGDRRLIYVNGFHKSFLNVVSDVARLTSKDTTLPASTYTFDWTRRSVVVCDGGVGFFGVLYDPARDRLSQFHFNEGS